jgi:hypothetical protein
MSFFNPKEEFKEAINEWLGEVATSIAQRALELAGKYINAPTNVEEVALFSYFSVFSQAVSYGLLALSFYGGILRIMKESALGESEPDWLPLVGNTAIAASFIFATRWIILDFLIPISNEFINFVGKAPIKWNLTVDAILNPIKGAGVGWAETAFDIIIMVLIWSIGSFALCISSLIRYGQLFVAIILGPILAARYSPNSAVFMTYWKEVIALVFTGPIHMTMFALTLANAGKGTFEGLIWSVSFAVVGAFGPSILKGYLHRSGAGAAMVGGGRFIYYRVMFAGLKGIRG